MKEEDSIIKAEAIYNGYSLKSNYDVELKLLFTEEQITNAIQFVAGIGQQVKMLASVAGENVALGKWSVYRLAVNRNAQTTVVFKSTTDKVIVGNLQKLTAEDELILLKAKVVEE